MQIHGPSVMVDEIGVRLNPGNVGEPFAVIDFGGMMFCIESTADADKLIRAAVLAKSLLLSETSQPVTAQDDAGRAIAADLGERAWDGRGIGAEDVPGWDDPLPGDPGGCEASRIGFGRCANEQPYHPGWHQNANGAGWPQYDEDIDLDAILTGDSYELRPYTADVTR